MVFRFRLVDSLNVETNVTAVVSRLDEQLTTSFEYSVVYYWYVVCLTVLLPGPLLTGVAGVLVVSLLRRSRIRREKVPPVKPSGSDVHDPSASPRRRRCCASDERSLDSLRLHTALIILYLLFTGPRATMTCLQGFLTCCLPGHARRWPVFKVCCLPAVYGATCDDDLSSGFFTCCLPGHARR